METDLKQIQHTDGLTFKVCEDNGFSIDEPVMIPSCVEKHITALEERAREFENIHPDILNFAKTMQYKMDKNKNKPHKLMNPNGDNRTYGQLSLATLYDLMCGEIAELKDALLEYEHFGASQNSVRYECADVANFAMMIHENIINNQGE